LFFVIPCLNYIIKKAFCPALRADQSAFIPTASGGALSANFRSKIIKKSVKKL